MTTLLLSISNNTSQLAEFCSMMIPCIWTGNHYQQPNKAFKNYVQKILKATQISFSCLILSLYYIHKLRLAYPSIKASIGSEFRLFITALLLANKFLDDSTFTNKTWSEVSSISIKELNIMEVEFLSALNYNIHIKYQQYLDWLEQCQKWWSTMHIHKPVKRALEEEENYYQIKKSKYSICKPILSWSSSTITAPIYSNDFNFNFNYPNTATITSANNNTNSSSTNQILNRVRYLEI